MASIFQINLLKQVYKKWILYGEPLKKHEFIYHVERDIFENELKLMTISELLKKSNDGYTITDAGRFKFRIVLTGGAYDLLHKGHIITLKEAAAYGEFLIVVVARDITVRTRKREPIHADKDRAYLLNALKIVDAAILGDEIDHMRVVRKIKPDVIAIGADQHYLEEKLKEQIVDQGMTHTKIVRLNADYEDMATTKLINSILEKY